MLAQFIQKQRKKLNLSQEYIASELGLSRPSYLQIEQGEKDLTIPEAQKLAAIFGISFDFFLKEKEASVVVEVTGKSKIKPTAEEIRISIPQEKVDKFKQILFYILKKVGGKPNVGMTVIYKLLYFIDFDYYEKFEEQLMGLVYVKNHHGPTPHLFGDVVAEMIKNGQVEVIKSKFYQFPQTKYLLNPSIEPDLDDLTGTEMEHIDWELQKHSDSTASELSELSHKDTPWLSAENGQALDYEAVFYRTPDTSVRTYTNEDNN